MKMSFIYSHQAPCLSYPISGSLCLPYAVACSYVPKGVWISSSGVCNTQHHTRVSTLACTRRSTTQPHLLVHGCWISDRALSVLLLLLLLLLLPVCSWRTCPALTTSG